jgi:transposase
MAPTVPLFVGLDYSQHAVQVCVLDRAGKVLCNARCPDDAARIQQLVQRFGTVQGSALEACTGAADLAQELADRFAWPMHLGHPGFVSRMKQSPDKSDFSDARVLADLERVGHLPRVWIAPKPLRELRTLVRDRQQLVAQRRNLKLAITALLREYRQRCAHKRWTAAWRLWLEHQAQLPEQARWVMTQRLCRLEWVAAEVRAVERRLEEVTNDDSTVRWLRTIKGLGPVTAWTVRAEVGRFDRFRSGKQLARFCGLSPCNRSSGDREADAGLIRAADPELRRVFVEAAWVLIRCQPRWRQLAERLKAQGKPSTVATAAVANRFVRWLYHEGVRQQAAA